MQIFNLFPLTVIKDNISIEDNKTIGLLGPNGCGKTTTIGMMLGLIEPTQGQVLVDGKNINKVVF